MVSIKKTVLAVLALGVSGVASAAMYTPAPAPAPACSGDVTAPCLNAWNIGIAALYVQTNGITGVTESATTSGTSETENLNDLSPNWGWGFRLEGSYHWGTGSDFNINWTHFNKTTDNDTDGVEAEFLGGLYDTTSSSVDNKLDQVNLELGQTINIGEATSVRFHGGLSFARVESDLDQSGTYTNIDGESAADTFDQDSKFSGWGPRAGVDAKYMFHNGFSIVASSAAALYVGDRDNTNTFTTVDADGDDNFSETETSSTRIIVPELEGSIGLRYDHPMSMHGGDCALELGYQVANYFDALDRSSDNAGEFPAQTESFAYQAVYLKATWTGNV